MTAGFQSFGRVFPAQATTMGRAEAEELLRSGGARGATLLACGNGRSYGDSCLNSAGAVALMRPGARILSFDPDSGELAAEAGVLLSDIIAHVVPHGFFPPVVPGTQFVTLGGAIANDIHGKNHHGMGTFGAHVLEIELLRSDGVTHRLGAAREPDLFSATIGGMGLTGLILAARVRMMRVATPDIAQTVMPFSSLAEYFDLAPEADRAHDYAVAWVDQLAGGSASGRGLLITGNHASSGARAAISAGGRLSVPVQPPFNLLGPRFLKMFNAAYRWKTGRAPAGSVTGYQGFFFPLDGVRNWNRLYGPRGLFQHQSVIPEAEAPRTVAAMLEAAREAGQGSFLTVLKRFGDIVSPGLLSFPRPGYTLTLDFPNRGAPTLALLDRLDRLTIEAGGAVNPYKDARMSRETFAASFPQWERLEAMRDPSFASDFWRRTALAPRTAGKIVSMAAE